MPIHLCTSPFDLKQNNTAVCNQVTEEQIISVINQEFLIRV